MKKKKNTKKLTNKQKIILVLITIILGVGAYFLGTILTKNYLNKKNMVNKDIDFSEMTKLETVDSISLDKLIKQYNKVLTENNLASYGIDYDNLSKKNNLYEYTINNVTYVFQTTNKKVEIMTIYYKEENDDIKEIIKLAMKANNENLSDEDVTSIYDNIIKTRDNEEKDNYKTSQFFQYKGIETSLKETINGDKSIYQFRIGRITE